MTTLEYQERMNKLVLRLLEVIEEYGFTASEAEGVPGWLKPAIDRCNRCTMEETKFKAAAAPKE